MAIGVYLVPHYLAPFTAAFYALGLQGMRHLRAWKPNGMPAGLALARLLVTICIAMAGLRVFAEPLHLTPPQWPGGLWIFWWYGPGDFGGERAQIETRLQELPGPQLAIVRYSQTHQTLEEWVYNEADIDGSKVIWAQEMDAAANLELIHYYRDRKVWLVQPDSPSMKLLPYPIPSMGESPSAGAKR
jgi:hypothetical protein